MTRRRLPTTIHMGAQPHLRTEPPPSMAMGLVRLDHSQLCIKIQLR